MTNSRIPMAALALIFGALTVASLQGTSLQGAAASRPMTGERIRFNRDIRPILSENCFACHGPDRNKRQANLRLDTRQGLLGANGKPGVVLPGRPDDSELWKRVTSSDADEQMPPPKFGKTLTTGERHLLRRWIEQGADWEGHWAFLPITRPVPPAPKPPANVQNDVDRFILQGLSEHALTPSPEADPLVLIRRLKLDLTGLPPTNAEIDAFLADSSKRGYEKLVDRLLGSPEFGERMAMWWLDLVRYADSVGYHGDQAISVSPYRDYVIRSFNENKPFDQFTLEQIAGDLLPRPTVQQKVAAGYNRLGMMSAEGGLQPKEYLAKYIAERVRNVGGAWLGVTLACCECHDHKFDPFLTRDFYAMESFFADIKERGLYSSIDGEDSWGPRMPVPTAEQQADRTRLEARIAELKRGVGARADAASKGALKAAQAEMARLDANIPTTLITVAVPPRTIRVLARGNWMDDTGAVVVPAFPHVLSKSIPHSGRLTRVDLAHWLTSRDNPLTARVFVNRMWKLFFGAGISRKLDDVGAQGDWPSHPELLDWLAGQFIDSGWNVKHVVKLIVMSATYRQSSELDPQSRERDPDNRWLSRQSRFRLDAETVRDSALFVSGLLVEKIGGPSVKPYQPPGYWAYLNFPPREWENSKGDGLYRRSLYTHWQRQYLHPAMLAFDAPSREECTADRPRSNTPLQSLVLMNDPEFIEAARTLAERILLHGGSTDAARLAWGFRTALGRPPIAAERDVLQKLLMHDRAEYSRDTQSVNSLLSTGAHPVAAEVDRVQLAAWTGVCRTILNLHEMVTRN